MACAARDFSRVIELDPEDAESYYETGMSRVELGEYHGAIDDFDHAARLDPHHPYAAQERDIASK